jgi:hypothetical protein
VSQLTSIKGLNSWGRSLVEDARIVQESHDEVWSSNIQVHMVREKMPDHLKYWMYSNSFLFYNMNLSETINRTLTYLTASLSTSQILRTLQQLGKKPEESFSQYSQAFIDTASCLEGMPKTLGLVLRCFWKISAITYT